MKVRIKKDFKVCLRRNDGSNISAFHHNPGRCLFNHFALERDQKIPEFGNLTKFTYLVRDSHGANFSRYIDISTKNFRLLWICLKCDRLFTQCRDDFPTFGQVLFESQPSRCAIQRARI